MSGQNINSDFMLWQKNFPHNYVHNINSRENFHYVHNINSRISIMYILIPELKLRT